MALAVMLALAAILLGAIFLIAPPWQFSYRAARYVPVGPKPAEEEKGASAEAEQENAPEEPAEQSSAPPININTATAEELAALPGIGEAKAAAIVAYREQNGPFASLQDVAKVKGVSQAMTESWLGLAETN
ncbi:MAG: ComEA family DNA-binding protein [Gemmiger sp.]